MPEVTSHDYLSLSPIVAGLWRLTEWQMDVRQRVQWIEQALELGITSFDHADIYGDYRVETLFGVGRTTTLPLASVGTALAKTGEAAAGSEAAPGAFGLTPPPCLHPCTASAASTNVSTYG